MSIDKVKIGKKILKLLLDYGKMIDGSGTCTLKIGRFVIRVAYHYLNLARMYKPHDTTVWWSPYEGRKDRYTHHSLFIGFKGKLDFYKDFSMYYVFVDQDDGSQRLRSIQERQYHGENFSYWTTTYGLPYTEERIYSMLYDAMNLAFGYKNNPEKFEKMINKIKMNIVREV